MSAEQVMEIMKEAMLVAFEIAGPFIIIGYSGWAAGGPFSRRPPRFMNRPYVCA